MKHYILHTLYGCILLMVVTACGSSRKIVADGTQPLAFNSQEILSKVETMPLTPDYMTAKMKLNIQQGKENFSIGGNLRMHRDDVIQLSLVAFGLMEAARIEFTPEDMLVVDKINKRYVRCSYSQLSFLQQAELDFQSLQALFRNELFIPGKKQVEGNETLLKGSLTPDQQASYEYQNKQLSFRFLIGMLTTLVQQVQVAPAHGGNQTFRWVYDDFQPFGNRSFPLQHKLEFQGTPRIQVALTLHSLSENSRWETRTTVKESYQSINAEVLIKSLLQLN